MATTFTMYCAEISGNPASANNIGGVFISANLATLVTNVAASPGTIYLLAFLEQRGDRGHVFYSCNTAWSAAGTGSPYGVVVAIQ